jgi:hypothetical protein
MSMESQDLTLERHGASKVALLSLLKLQARLEARLSSSLAACAVYMHLGIPWRKTKALATP